MKALIYCRISSDPEGLRAGVTRQREDCVSFCESKGWSWEVYEDNDSSAYRGKPRPGWEACLEALESGGGGVLVAWAPDRFTRHLSELEALVGLLERTGARAATVQAGEWDLSSPEGRFQARLIGMVARLESEKAATRIKRARQQEAEVGRPMMGGKVKPYGFEEDRITHDPEEAANLRWSANHLLSGGSLYSVSKKTGMQGFNIKRALLSPRMVGLRELNGKRYKAQWEPILDLDVWEALHAMYEAKPAGQQVGSEKQVKHLLSGIARCICGSPVVGGRNAHGAPAYKCREVGCNKLCRTSERLDEYVRDALLQRPEVAVPSLAVDVDSALYSAVEGYRLRIERNREAWEEGRTGDEDYTASQGSLRTKLIKAQEQLAAAIEQSQGFERSQVSEEETGEWAETLRTYNLAEKYEWWDHEDTDIKQRRALIRQHIDFVQLSPAIRGKRFDQEAVQIHWHEKSS